MNERRIYQLSDCHLSAEETQPTERLIYILNQIEQNRVSTTCSRLTFNGEQDILLLTGDLVCQPTLALYQAFKAAVETHTSISHIYAIAGNHDDRDLMKTAFQGSRIQMRSRIPLDHQCQIICLDSSDKPFSEMALGSGRLAKRGLSALKSQSRKKQSIVVIHHPLLNVGAQWFQEIGIENNLKVMDAIHPQTIAVLSGHAHAHFDLTLADQVPQRVCPATSYGFNHDVDDYQRTDQIGFMCHILKSEEPNKTLHSSAYVFEAK